MMTINQNGVKSFIIPDNVVCICEGDYINEMDECPMQRCEEKNECNPDCEYYTEYCE